ncbi:MAG: hypothetical protein ACR2N8_01185 [Parvibaculales bacterium]
MMGELFMLLVLGVLIGLAYAAWWLFNASVLVGTAYTYNVVKAFTDEDEDE